MRTRASRLELHTAAIATDKIAEQTVAVELTLSDPTGGATLSRNPGFDTIYERK
jgi:hypothetical protein